MRELVVGLPDQLGRAIPGAAGFAIDLSIPGPPPSVVVVVGMGGSAIAGDLVAAATADRRQREVVVVRDYALPGWLAGDAIVIASSYSGNTEETLAAYGEAKARGLRAVAITTGGRLGEWAEAAGDPVHRLPSGYPPRAALGVSLAACALVVARLDPGLDPEEARAELTAAATATSREGSEWAGWSGDNVALALAAAFAERLPIIVGGSPLSVAAARRWKAQLNENGKVPAWTAELPEHNHNEIVGFEGDHPAVERTAVVYLETPWDEPRVTRRIEVVEALCASRVGFQRRILERGATRYEALLRLCWLGDWVSFFVSIVTGRDPTPVASIDQLKSALGDRGGMREPKRVQP